MNLTKLFELQKALDDRIIEEKKLQGKNLFWNKVLALQVEMGELANEWRRFKHWSDDKEPRRERMLEEYVDCLHFVLSLGLDIGVEIPESGLKNERDTITSQFVSMMAFTNEDGTPMDWEDLWGHFIGLGEMLGFSWAEVEAAYIRKNDINHLRQDEGY